ncbi:MAG: hypothetical protein LEGION0403_FIIPPAGN_00781 [Legionella sp.]|uniref:YchJ family protein n=1 Tax=Legionella sp. TaxID=459 RepID=UPI003D0C813C
MTHCPCGTQKTYEQCCGLYLEKKQLPQTPEQLMRSRYTAYSLANIDYIKNTMKGQMLVGFNSIEAEQWANSVTWLGLEVLSAEPPDSDTGFVEFCARLMDHGQAKVIHELSEFHREDGSWFYVNGVNKEKPAKIKKQQISRNGPCPCGSGKKYKNCHAK